MSWKTEVSLKNKSSNDVFCKIPKGQIFENKKIGTGIQNVAASRDYKLIIPANSKLTVEIEVLCINRSLSPPSGSSGNIAIYQIDKPFANQDELWKIMQTPMI